MHNYCITPETFEEHQALGSMFEVLATNEDAERNGWEWTEEEEIDHSPEAIVAMHHIAAFLVKESRKSGHRFVDKEEERKRLIYNTPPHLLPTEEETSMYAQTYFWLHDDVEVGQA